MAQAQFQPKNQQGKPFKIEQVAGYRVVGCFYPHVGIRRSFHVYLFERQDATTPFQPIDVGSGAQPPRGTLSLSVMHREHSFNDIELLRIETTVGHRERQRLTTFGYMTEGEGPISAEFNYHNDLEIKDNNKLGDNYKFGFGTNFKDNLLGLHSLITPSGKVVVRLSSIPNNKRDSWMKKLIALNNDWSDNRQSPPHFDLILGERKLILAPESLDCILIDESYGSMMAMPQPSLGQLYNTNRPETMLGVGLTRDRPSEWVDHWNTRDFHGLTGDDRSELAPSASRSSVETATIILKPQNYNDLNIA